MDNEIKEILDKFNKEVEKAELTRNPYSSEDKKFKHIIVSLSEKYFNIFKDILDYITNLQEENKKLSNARYSLDRVELEKRIDKAIEYINFYINRLLDNDIAITPIEMNYLKNILQGEDKDE